MNTIVCRRLNLIETPFIETFDLKSLPKVRHTRLDHNEVISNTIKNLLLSLNLEITLLEIFYSPPFFNSGIHIDSTGGDYTKINWIVGGEDSRMNWYSPIVTKTTKNKTSINTNYIPYKFNEVRHLYSEKITGCSLVQVGAPHNIVNNAEERWCISLVFVDHLTRTRPSMSKSIDVFKNLIIEEDSHY